MTKSLLVGIKIVQSEWILIAYIFFCIINILMLNFAIMKSILFFFLFLPIFLFSQNVDTVYTAATRAFNDKAYNFALQQFERIIQNHQESKYFEDSLYYAGAAVSYLENYDKAVNYFKRYLDENRSGLLVNRTYYHLALIFFYRDKNDLSLGYCANALLNCRDQKLEADIRILKGDIYQKLGVFETMLKEYQSAALLAPYDAELKLAVWYYEQKKYPQAMDFFNNLSVDKSPWKEQALYYKIKINMAVSNFTGAALLTENFLNSWPRSGYSNEIAFLKAYLPFEEKKYDEALAALQNFILYNSSSGYFPAAVYYLGRSYEFLNQPVLALEQYNLAASSAEGEYSWRSLYRIIQYYREQNDFNKALQGADRLASADSALYREIALREKIILLLSINKHSEAKSVMKTFAVSFPHSIYTSELLTLFAESYAVNGDKERAARELILLSDQAENPREKADWLYKAAGFLLDSGLTNQASDLYRNITEKFPTLEIAEYAKESTAWIAFSSGNYKQAAELYLSLQNSISPVIRETAWFRSAQCSYLAGDLDTAFKTFLFFSGQYTGSSRLPEVFDTLGRICYRRQKYNDAYNWYRRLQDYPESAAKAGYWMGWALYRQGAFKDALSVFTPLHEKYPDSPFSWEALITAAKINFNSSAVHEAIALYSKIISHPALPVPELKTDALYETGICYIHLRDIRQSEFIFKRLQELTGRKKLLYGAYFSLAELCYSDKKFIQAYTHYLFAAEQADGTAEKDEAQYRAALAAREIPDLGKAAETARELYRREASDRKWDAAMLLASIISLDHTAAALEIYNDITLKSSRQDIRKDAADKIREISDNKTKKKLEKISSAEEVSEIKNHASSPEVQALVYLKTADLYKKNKNMKSALENYKAAAMSSGGPASMRAQYEIALYYYERSEFDLAYQNFMSLIYLFDNIESLGQNIFFYTGYSAYKTGNYSDAREYLQRYLDISPAGENSQKTRETLKLLQAQKK